MSVYESAADLGGPAAGRQHELDWLRVIAILAVLFQHVSLLFVAGGELSWSPEPSAVVRFIGEHTAYWRMPLLFFVAGAACALAGRRKDSHALMRERVTKLVVPLAFAVVTYAPATRWIRRAVAMDLYEWGRLAVEPS